jgi:hypothetical protein
MLDMKEVDVAGQFQVPVKAMNSLRDQRGWSNRLFRSLLVYSPAQ